MCTDRTTFQPQISNKKTTCTRFGIHCLYMQQQWYCYTGILYQTDGDNVQSSTVLTTSANRYSQHHESTHLSRGYMRVWVVDHWTITAKEKHWGVYLEIMSRPWVKKRNADRSLYNLPGDSFCTSISRENNHRQSPLELATEAPGLQNIHRPQSQLLQAHSCASLCLNIIQLGVANETMTAAVVIRLQTMVVMI